MTSNIKHIGLSLGLLLTIISFLFFGRQSGTYLLLLIGGLLISTVFYLTILFSNGTTKSKFIWTFVVVIAAAIQWLTEPILVKGSYLIYLMNHKSELTQVNNILIHKVGEIYISKNEINDKEGILTQIEKDNLIKLREKLDVYTITKSDDGIYYGLYGFLDVRLGITYWTKIDDPNISYQHLKDNWYY